MYVWRGSRRILATKKSSVSGKYMLPNNPQRYTQASYIHLRWCRYNKWYIRSWWTRLATGERAGTNSGRTYISYMWLVGVNDGSISRTHPAVDRKIEIKMAAVRGKKKKLFVYCFCPWWPMTMQGENNGRYSEKKMVISQKLYSLSPLESNSKCKWTFFCFWSVIVVLGLFFSYFFFVFPEVNWNYISNQLSTIDSWHYPFPQLSVYPVLAATAFVPRRA